MSQDVLTKLYQSLFGEHKKHWRNNLSENGYDHPREMTTVMLVVVYKDPSFWPKHSCLSEEKKDCIIETVFSKKLRRLITIMKFPLWKVNEPKKKLLWVKSIRTRHWKIDKMYFGQMCVWKVKTEERLKKDWMMKVCFTQLSPFVNLSRCGSVSGREAWCFDSDQGNHEKRKIS